MENVSAVLPAYNEGKTVAQIVKVLKNVPEVGEVIVVSDGSVDDTAVNARAAGAYVVELQQNKGKGGAVAAGIAVCQNDVLLLLDADLIGLTPDHVRDLIEPVLSLKADMAVGIFVDGNFITDLAQKVAPYLSGQRALRKSHLTGLTLEHVGYGLEINLTCWAASTGLKVKRVPLRNMSHTMKEMKCGLIFGIKSRARMYRDVATTYVRFRKMAAESGYVATSATKEKQQPLIRWVFFLAILFYALTFAASTPY